MNFQIEIRTGYKEYTLNVEQINVTDVSEQFKISSLNGTNYIIIQSNRPFFRKKGLKKRKPNYEVIEGKVKYKKYLNEAFLKIMQEVEPHNYPKPNPIMPQVMPRLLPRKEDKPESTTHWGDSIRKSRMDDSQNILS